MILFGLAEVRTGFTHNFLSLISTTNIALATYGAAGVGALYAMGGLLLLTMKKRAVVLGRARGGERAFRATRPSTLTSGHLYYPTCLSRDGSSPSANNSRGGYEAGFF